MGTTRVKKIGGRYTDKGFVKVLRQLNGRAVLVVMVINSNCDECVKLHKFVSQLEQGFIDKLPQLVMIYGINDQPLDQPLEKPVEKPGRLSRKDSESSETEKGQSKKSLADTRILTWDSIPEGHGYAIFLSETEVLYYKGAFDHDECVPNIIDNMRRFRSSIRTLAGLTGKRVFIESKRSGIIIETSGTTQNSQIIELENKVKSFEKKVNIPMYFCKSITQEISLVVEGETKTKMKGLNLEKFLRKIQKT
jgi:hypothetical protein